MVKSRHLTRSSIGISSAIQSIIQGDEVDSIPSENTPDAIGKAIIEYSWKCIISRDRDFRIAIKGAGGMFREYRGERFPKISLQDASNILNIDISSLVKPAKGYWIVCLWDMFALHGEVYQSRIRDLAKIHGLEFIIEPEQIECKQLLDSIVSIVRQYVGVSRNNMIQRIQNLRD